MTTQTQNTVQFEFKPLPKKRPKMPIYVPMTLLTLALVVVTVVFLAGGDAATGLGRAGWTALGIAGACFIGIFLSLLLRRTLLGFNAIAFIVLTVFFGVLGLGGVLVEPLVHNLQGDNLKTEGQYEQAMTEYRKGDVNNLKTKIPESYWLLGHQLVKNKSFAQGIEQYIKISNPEFIPNKFTDTAKKEIGATYLNWGLELENSAEKFDEALAKYDEVVKDGNNQDAIDRAKSQAQGIIFRVGDNALEAGEYDKALATYKSAVQLYGASEGDLRPYFSRTYLNWGKALLANGDFEGAITKLEINIKQYAAGQDLNLSNLAVVDCYAGIGKKLLADKKYDELLSKLAAAFTTYGRFDTRSQLQGLLGDGLIQQGVAAEDAKDYARAIDSYEKAFPYVGSRGEVRNDLTTKLVNLHITQSEALVAQNQFDKAIESYRRALQRYPNPATNGSLRTGIAKAYAGWADQADKAGDFQAALDRNRIILRDYPDLVDFTKPASDAQPRLIFSLAGKLVNDKQYDAAFSRYQEVINSYGNTSYGTEAKNILALSQDVTVTILDRNGKALPNLKIKLDEDYTLNDAGEYVPKGRSLDFTTNANGAFTIKLVPGKVWLLSFYKNGNYSTSFAGTQPANTVRSQPLRTTNISQTVNLP